jgi:glycosyltransferase involved in cell wall biosynthesis
MSASAASRVQAGPAPEAFGIQKQALRVLTLTPFYPSADNDFNGCFIRDPLLWTSRLAITNEVIAAQPFYRGRVHSAVSIISSQWTNYFSVPGNQGLAMSGAFLAASLSRRVRRMHEGNRFDLIHAHGALPCGHAARSLSKSLSIPFVVSVHGLDAYSDRQVSGVLGRHCGRVAEDVYRSAKAVVCVSEKVRERVGAGVNSVVVYNGVDPEIFSPEPESSERIILSVGNLIATKGHATLIRAFANVARAIPTCILEIIGDGPERQILTALAAELGVSSRVWFRGRQGRKETAAAMRRCTVFALPSHYEGLGCVYLEAMACAKPVIGCKGQGISELIEQGVNGFLSHRQNEAELSDLLLALLENETLRWRVGISARHAILQKHTLEHQAAQLAQLYQECVQ